MARPTKFTPERRERFLSALPTGVFPETAARFAGWSAATLYRILRGTTPAHVAFRDDVRRIETELELRLAGTVTQAAFSDPRLALSLLERRFGERWGRRATLLGAGSDEAVPGQPSAGVIVLEPAILQTIVPALLAVRVGQAATPEARRRVGRFALRPSEEAEE
jgi:hypothetical protein